LDNGSLSGGAIDVQLPVVCVGDTITFTVSGVRDSGGVKRVDCSAKTWIPEVTPSYTWRITRPDGTKVPPADQPPGSGSVATVVADIPGSYSCTFTATADRECPPAPLTLPLSTVNVQQSAAALAADPTAIAAKTACPAIPDYSYSEVTVQWDPPDCEGTLAIAEVVPDDMYLPSGNGTLERIDVTKWRYTAFDESPDQKHPKRVVVWIAAKQGNQELARVEVVVRTGFKWWISGHKHGPGAVMHSPNTADYLNAYAFIRWKYATCLGTTGGAFSGTPTINMSLTIPCGNISSAAACTNWLTDSVEFAASTFTQDENVAASLIGHELVHTVGLFGLGECEAYTWEMDHYLCTAIGSTYLQLVINDKTAACRQQ
jgi:hypothetical protein